MNLPVFLARADNPDDRSTRKLFFACVACIELGPVDRFTGFCRSCWRVVILDAAVRAEREAGAARGEDPKR